MTESKIPVDPGGCARKIIDLHGDAGVEWLRRLPELMAECARRWSLAVLPPFAELSYNYVTPAVRADGVTVVIKAGPPNPELLQEIAALRHFDGAGMVRLLDADPEQGVLLLERLLPGTPLEDLDDDEEITRAAARVMQRLWKPVPVEPPLVTVAKWAGGLKKLHARFDGGYGPFPRALVDRAEALFPELLSSGTETVLLHGDLHPQNILKSEREPWLGIDPKGVAGDRLYDVAVFVISFPETLPEPEARRMLLRRADQLADLLGFDRRQILAWALAQCVLSGWWSFEDHGRGWEGAFARAELLTSLQ